MPELANTHFTDLVRDRRVELGLSYDSLARLCVDPDTGEQLLKSSWLHRLEKGQPTNAPSGRQLEVLAGALRLPVDLVKEAAAAQYLGIEPSDRSGPVWSEDHTTRIVVARMSELTDAERKVLADLAETIARSKAAPSSNDASQ